ncbi:MAG: filamentous hemagglutinin N-terminal domain-containing protein, partial [Gammaproteobacteria bacterium]
MVRKRKTGKKAVQPIRSRRLCAERLNPVTSFIRTALPAGLLFGLHAGAAYAGPEGGVVAAGEGSIATPNATTTNINQVSNNLIVNWQSFNVNANETVNFNQPSAQARALNRIFDQNPSQIFGSINANGHVTLLNSNGLFISPTAHVNVGSLIASGLDISDEDFMNGKHVFFNKDGSEGGQVVNRGLIEAATGGSVTLIGGAVKNEGTIVATAGQVNLVAGKKVTMDFDGDGLMQFTIDEKILENVHDLDNAVTNSGTISAEGGTVLLKGSAAKDVFT